MSVTIPVPMLDLSGEYKELEQEWFAAIHEAGSRGAFVLGAVVEQFEQQVADYLGVKYAIGVANGTDALHLSLRAMGIGPGDEVITSPYTFFATSEAIDLVGATPVFADIDQNSFALDMDSVASKINSGTKAIIPVHLFGYPADMQSLMQLTMEHELPVIEDAAQAFGAKSGDSFVGSLGKTGCFSFYPAKMLGCYGDGGLVTTNDARLNADIRRLRNHGASAPFVHTDVGFNSRLDAIQAALLSIKLKRFECVLEARRCIAERYDEALAGLDLRLPSRPKAGRHAFNLYTIRSSRRGEIKQAFENNQIGYSIYYPKPLHLQDVYSHLNYKPGDLPVCEQSSRESISLPIYPALTNEQVDRVCEVVKDVFV